MSVFLYGVEHDLTPMLMVVGAIMFAGWALAYAQIVAQCFRDRTYGLPLASIFLNISWEFLFAFQLVAPLISFLVWGNRLWFCVDVVIVTQVFLYGRQTQTNPWVRRHFYTIAVLSIVLSVLGLYSFATYFNDVYGVASSFLMNFAMSLLFIAMLFARPDLKGLPYGAAWSKMIGTAAGAVFCYIWWPMQFADGRLARPPYVPEPTDYRLLYFLYITIPIIDCLYIYLHRRRQKELAAAAGTRGTAAPALG